MKTKMKQVAKNIYLLSLLWAIATVAGLTSIQVHWTPGLVTATWIMAVINYYLLIIFFIPANMMTIWLSVLTALPIANLILLLYGILFALVKWDLSYLKVSAHVRGIKFGTRMETQYRTSRETVDEDFKKRLDALIDAFREKSQEAANEANEPKSEHTEEK